MTRLTNKKSGLVLVIIRYCHALTLFVTLLIIHLQVFSGVTGLMFV